MQYEWTPPQLFFCRYCVLQLFCHNVERAHEIKCSQKQLEVKFYYFRDLGLIIPENRTFYRTPLDDCFCFKTVSGFILCNYI